MLLWWGAATPTKTPAATAAPAHQPMAVVSQAAMTSIRRRIFLPNAASCGAAAPISSWA